MRPLPRRSNVHRYPILKWFSKTAYKRSYLWSFRSREIIPALFIGMWIAMLPIVSIQMLVVFIIALCIRANLPVIVALQWISNPFTMGPIYFADYKIGIEIFRLLGISSSECCKALVKLSIGERRSFAISSAENTLALRISF